MLRLMSVREFRNTPNKLWRSLHRDKAVALAVNGVPKALVLDVADGDLESLVALVRQIRSRDALMQLRLQAAAAGADQLTDAEIDAEIAATRPAARPAAKRARSA
jgi:hypothetical protein